MGCNILNCAVVKGSGNVLYLVLNGKKYLIESEEIMKNLFTHVYYTLVSDKCLNALPDGETLSASSRLIGDSHKKAYLSINNHLKLPIADFKISDHLKQPAINVSTFEDMGFDASKLQVLSSKELEGIPTGETIQMGQWGWEHEDWMSCVPDDTLLSRVSIPGTHDTMSYTCYHKEVISDAIKNLLGAFIDTTAACQSKPLEEQLKMGARFFDLRLDHDMRFFHGITPLNLVSEDAMQVLSRFLNEHPDETILLRIKSENTDQEAVYRTNFEKEVIARYRSYFWSWSADYNGMGVKDEHGVVIPSLGEVRGKFVLFNSYLLEEQNMEGKKEYIGYQLCSYQPASSGEPFPVTCQHLQDQYKLGSKPEKAAAIMENARAAEKCSDPIYSINFLSGVDAVPIPQVCAMVNNPKIEKFLIDEIRATTGIMVMDFMGEKEGVTPRVLFTNFRRHS